MSHHESWYDASNATWWKGCSYLTTAQRLDNFKKWFLDNGGFIHPDTELSFCTDNGICLRAIKPISQGTLIISCPHNLTISSLNANGTTIESPVSSNNDDRQRPKSIKLPISYARNQCQAAMFLSIQYMQRDQSFWSPYIDLLPLPPSQKHQPERHAVDTPIWWTESQRSQLNGTALESGIAGLEAMWKSDWHQTRPAVESWLHRNDSNDDSDVEQEELLKFETFQWALTIFGSRAFGSSQLRHVMEEGNPILSIRDPDSLLYPGVDMLNHSVTTKNTWFCDAQRFGILCNDVPRAGDEIVNTYGAKSNSQLLLSWGFVIPRSLHDSYALKLASSVHLRSYDFPPALAEDQYPDRRPPALDIEHSIYYIRGAERHLLHEHGYHDAHANRSQPHLAGFPIVLLEALAFALCNNRERQIANYLLTDPIRKPSFPQAFGLRNIFVVTNLLLSRLRVEEARVKGAERSSMLRASDDYLQDLKRSSTASSFRLNQEHILRSNIDILQAYLGTLINADKSPSFAKITYRFPTLQNIGSIEESSHVLSLAEAMTLLKITSATTHESLLSGLELHLESRNILVLEDAGWSMDIWALWLYAILTASLDEQSEPLAKRQRTQSSTVGQHLKVAVQQWRTQDVANHKVDPEALSSVKELVNGIRESFSNHKKATTQHDESVDQRDLPPSMWHDALSEDMLRRAVYLVGEEVVSVELEKDKVINVVCLPLYF